LPTLNANTLTFQDGASDLHVSGDTNIYKTLHVQNDYANVYKAPTPVITTTNLNNYGTILIDGSAINDRVKDASLTVSGNLINNNTIDIGAGAKLNITSNNGNGNLINNGLITLQAGDVNRSNKPSFEVGHISVASSATFDISMGSKNRLSVNIGDINSLSHAELNKDYELLKANGGINYTYSLLGQSATITSSSTNESLKDSNVFNKLGLKAPWEEDKAIYTTNYNNTSASNNTNTNTANTAIAAATSSTSGSDATSNTESLTKTNGGKFSSPYEYAKARMERMLSITSNGNDIIGKYLQVQKVITNNSIGFKIIRLDPSKLVSSASTPSACLVGGDSFSCALWMEAGGNNSWVDALKQSSVNGYDILRTLFYNPDTAINFIKDLDQTLYTSRDLNYFVTTAKTLDSSLRHAAGLDLKESSQDQIMLATQSQRLNRLVKLSSAFYERSDTPRYASLLKELEYKKFAMNDVSASGINNTNSEVSTNNVDNDNTVLSDISTNSTSLDTLALYQYGKRQRYPSNIWLSMIGNGNFSKVGNASLYGINTGYDILVKNFILGFYMAYGYGKFNGNNNFLSNDSNNASVGVYSRVFIGRHELDFNASELLGSTNEVMQASNDMPLLAQFNQKYDYKNYNTNVNITYGYGFSFARGVVVKPQVGLSYIFAYNGPIRGKAISKTSISNLLVNVDAQQKHDLALNAGLEVRKYFLNSSYVYILGELRQDLLVNQSQIGTNSKGAGKEVATVIGINSVNANGLVNVGNAYNLSYLADIYSSTLGVMGGGELAVNDNLYVNLGLTFRSSITDKNIMIGGSLGARVLF
ncbi:autotransporter outer membrane beta-barrel domain-containing protein, partial [Helicobacter sp. 11S02629-2]|uniref:autotransporter outer membrane beta-barrel domain-containing protein n=1 Tax=Helicobacter sp. 11S02629-2 TaxID=1476195 RepID=UPI001179986F